MNQVLLILALSLFVKHDVTEAFDDDAVMVADSQKGLITSDGPADDSTADNISTASDDVINCTTIDDVTEARKDLCPAQCICTPLAGTAVWTELTVDCSGH